MKFLTVLIVVFLHRNWVGGHPLREAVPARGYFNWFQSRNIAVNVRFVLCVGVPVLIALIISYKLHGWFLSLFWLAFALAVMLYAVDTYDEDIIFEDQRNWLDAAGDEVDIATMSRRQDDFRLVTTYELFQSIYPALFWFLVLGPAGALAYVLCKQYLDALDDDDPEMDLVERVVYFLEWPAARISGLLFALLGHFGRCFEVWVETLTDTTDSIGTILVRMALAAIDHEEPGEGLAREQYIAVSEASNKELRSLMDRTLFGWLGVATLVAILGF